MLLKLYARCYCGGKYRRNKTPTRTKGVRLKVEIHEIHEIHQNLRNPVSILSKFHAMQQKSTKSPPTPPTVISSPYQLNKQVEQSREFVSIK